MDVDFDRKWEHFDNARTVEKLSTVWSIYEVDNLYSEHPFSEATKVVYRYHWGGKTVSSKIKGNRFIDLYRAADKCIKNSGDNHHIYIEHFATGKRSEKVLYLSTGS